MNRLFIEVSGYKLLRHLAIFILITSACFSFADVPKEISKDEKNQVKATETQVADKSNVSETESAKIAAVEPVSPITQHFEELKRLQAEYDQIVTDAQVNADTGTQNIFRKQAYDSNNKIREEINQLIPLIEKIEDRANLLEYVKNQIVTIDQGLTYLSEQISTLERTFQSSKPEEQSVVLSKIEDNQGIALTVFRERWENQKWLNQLGMPDEDATAEVVKAMKMRLSFVASSLQSNNADIKKIGDQLHMAIESEKPRLLLTQSILQRRILMDNNQLTALISLATEMRVDTTEYKRILFESTAQFTNDLFDIKVIKSLLMAWTARIKSWLFLHGIASLLQTLVIVAIIWGGGKSAKVIEILAAKVLKSPKFSLSRLMQAFLSKTLGRMVFFIALLIALAQIGINLAPLLTGLGVAGIVIGFALQDTLSNFASGVMLLIYRPFDVNDYVNAGTVAGKVSHMSLVNTTIKTFDNQIIIVPNKMIWGGIITNITHERVRRVDMIFSIGYKDNVELAEQIFHDILDEHEKVLSVPERTVQLHTLAAHSLDFIVRPWVKTDDYWPVYWGVTREVKRRFDIAGINIPYPQQDVHLHVTKEYEPVQEEQVMKYMEQFTKKQES